jgi:ubiquinone biosynthesis protein COQ4
MTVQSLNIPAPPPRQPMLWRRARQSLRALLADPEDTEKAVDLTYAIGRNDFERAVQRFLSSARGRRLMERRPDLASALSDREALARMPENSLGRAYLAYLEANGFSATGLVDVERRVAARWQLQDGVPEIDAWRGWFRDRMIMTHDLSHVVTGYGTDNVGEATLLAFNTAQNGGRANVFLTFGACFNAWRGLGRGWPGYVFAAFRRGRRAIPLVEMPWEDLLPLPLETVRELTHLQPAEDAHPRGIWRADLALGAA